MNMLDRTGRRALAALVGVTAGVATLAVAPSAAHSAPAPSGTDLDALRQQIEAARPAPNANAALAGTCTSFVTIASGPLRSYYPSTAGGSPDCVLQNGNFNNTGVTKLQQNLNLCYGQGLTVDGDFGIATKTAVENVERAKSMPVNGVYDGDLFVEMRIAVFDVSSGQPVPYKDANGKPVCIP